MQQLHLRAGDVVVALQVAISPAAQLNSLAQWTMRSVGEVHKACRRLGSARLLQPEGRIVVRTPLLAFLRWGVPHAFPAAIGGPAIGLATAVLLDPTAPARTPGELTTVRQTVEFVWPTSEGTDRGNALTPLYASVWRLGATNPRLYSLVAAVDVLRIGGTRERNAAWEYLNEHVP